MAALRHTALVALSLAVAGTAGAQAAQCNISEGSPFQISSAKQNIARGISGKEADRERQQRDAIRVLTDNPEKINNQPGRNLLLGRAYLAWLNRPSGAIVMKRGAIGFTQNTDANIDVLAAFDSAMTQVQQLAPACADSVASMRRIPFGRLFNAAIEAFNEDKLDSAETLTKRAIALMPNSVNGYNLLSNIASKRNDTPAALAAMRKVIEVSASATDEASKKIRQTNMYNLAVLTAGQAETQEGDTRKATAQQAAELFRTYLKEVPGEPNGTQGLARSLQLAGDTAAIANIYADMMSNPEKFTDVQLFEAGVSASRAQRDSDAVKLYTAGLTKNPYFRDGLFNLANAYFGLKDHANMIPAIQRLLAVDPNNAQNWRLLAGAYQLRQRSGGTKADTDSLLKYLEKSEKLPYNVTINRFAHADAAHTLEGSIENRGKTPASFTMTVEFVDKDGQVVASQDVKVGPIDPNSSASFAAKVEGKGIMAYRMKPIQ